MKIQNKLRTSKDDGAMDGWSSYVWSSYGWIGIEGSIDRWMGEVNEGSMKMEVGIPTQCSQQYQYSKRVEIT
jgi:hypothetical protein